MNKGVILLFFLLLENFAYSQSKGVVIDELSQKPIPYVSIYSKKASRVVGTMTDKNGLYDFKHMFDTLFFSHINYEMGIVTGLRNDTIYLKPQTHNLGEITICAPDPNWLKKLLKDVVLNRESIYQNIDEELEYDFETKSLTDSTIYNFKSYGLYYLPWFKSKSSHRICPYFNEISTNVEDAKGDFAQMARSTYHNFILDFDNKFIKENSFVLTSFATKKTEFIQIEYTSKKHSDHTGFIIVDTIRKAIVEFEQKIGSRCNLKNNTNALSRSLALKKGFKYLIWDTTIHGIYDFIDEKYHFVECRYQYYIQTKNKEDVYFSNIESIIKLTKNTSNRVQNCDWLDLPSPYSILIIKSKNRRLSEEELSELPVLLKPL